MRLSVDRIKCLVDGTSVLSTPTLPERSAVSPPGNAATIATNLGFTNIDNGISRFPVGTIFFAFLEEGSGDDNEVKKVTPFDKNVMIVTTSAVPEPGTLALVTSGLIGVAAMIRKRLFAGARGDAV